MRKCENASRMLLYIVTMYRWGNKDEHSYPIGVFSSKTRAEKTGLAEYEFRGSGKYLPEITVFKLDESWNDRRNREEDAR